MLPSFLQLEEQALRLKYDFLNRYNAQKYVKQKVFW